MDEPLTVTLDVPFVYLTDHLWARCSTIPPGPWIDRGHPAVVNRGLAVQRDTRGELLLCGTPEEGSMTVVDEDGELLIDCSWITQTPLEASGLDRLTTPSGVGGRDDSTTTMTAPADAASPCTEPGTCPASGAAPRAAVGEPGAGDAPCADAHDQTPGELR